MLSCQSALFDLPQDIHYINCAYMSPQLKSVTETGMVALQRKTQPHLITGADFFEPLNYVQSLFARLIHCAEPHRIAIVPSVSYGIANAASNIPLQPGQHILLAEEQFPSNYFEWKKVADRVGATIQIISPTDSPTRGKSWNEYLLESINNQTAVVALGHVHWADGTLFDLKAIRERTKAVGAYLIIDGTQSVGALPFDVSVFQPDALVCGGYKWLFGPYSLGLAYYGERFDHGTPIEENWINRKNSDQFQTLSDYESAYRPFATRYSVGEKSNFVLLPMLTKALEQILLWHPENIQDYCESIAQEAIAALQSLGCSIEQSPFRAHHLIGVRLPQRIDLAQLKMALKANQVFVSMRGNSIRVAPHVYNDASDFEALVRCFHLAS